MFRQRLLSTDVLPYDVSSESSNTSPISANHVQNIFNRKHHIATQTTDHSSPVEQQQQQWLPISLNENASR
ncbi:unnamed protein product, partial [Rotaria magnacalcarata]